jgi:hypothetical protein
VLGVYEGLRGKRAKGNIGKGVIFGTAEAVTKDKEHAARLKACP